MKSFFLLSKVLFMVSFVANARVEIEINDKTYNFEQNPRLSVVLSYVASENAWYWQNSKLFKLDTQSIALEKQGVVDLLTREELDLDLKVRNHFIDAIKSWKLEKRIVLDIDFDLARFNSKNNPMIENGRYSLQLFKRPDWVHIFGAIEGERKIAYLENSCLSDLIEPLKKLDFADSDNVYVISPKGEVVKVPVAYWNRQCTQILPGSQVYIPIEENQIFLTSEKVNEAIVKLAVNRTLFQ